MSTSKRSTGNKWTMIVLAVLIIVILNGFTTYAQRSELKWSADGKSYYRIERNEIVMYTLPDAKPTVILSKNALTPSGKTTALAISNYFFSDDHSKILIYTNTERVWRLNTRGDYWVADLKAGTLKRLGQSFPESSLMFAKFSPDAGSVAYVSGHNIYVENLGTSVVTPLTTDGTTYLINGTFDWVYEEELFCRDGFRWSPDSKSIAYWQIDASRIRKFYMINNTDSVYSRIIPVEYPKVGLSPSPCRVGVVSVTGGNTTWMNIPGDPSQNYIPRMEYIPATSNLLIQQLNRKQNHSILYICDSGNGNAKSFQEESDKAWIDVTTGDENVFSADYTNKFIWLDGNRSILWTSEKDGWRHLYRIPLDGSPERLITRGDYDVISVKNNDLKSGYVYFIASPQNATEKYLYRTKLDGSGPLQRLTPEIFNGTNDYSVSPGCRYAVHLFSNVVTPPLRENITLPDHKPVNGKDEIGPKIVRPGEKHIEFFKIRTADSVSMDGWLVKPADFDPALKYPVVFYVYTEPWSTTVVNSYGASFNYLYKGDMAADGYIYISVDNRGTPAPKGREWRKSIYRKIGQLNIHDQAMAAREILKWTFIDTSRVAVWGWSGGGSATLNLMFQYPDIYKTGIAIAAVTSLLNYDNIYTERYMGLPQENMDDYIKGSPLTYAKNLNGHLLYIHGTGDDNVHYQNAEMLLNELIKYNKQFRFMPYPDRTHNISEGEGTFLHLITLYTEYLRQNCPPGGR